MRVTLHPEAIEHIDEIDKAIAFWRRKPLHAKDWPIKDVMVEVLYGNVNYLKKDKYNNIMVDYDSEVTLKLYAEVDDSCSGCPPVCRTIKLFADGSSKIIE